MPPKITELERKARRLDDLVENHERRSQELAGRLKSKQITKSEYLDSMAQSRRSAVSDILRVHQEDAIIGSGYYENLVYSTLKHGLHMQNGLQRAKSRIEEDILSLRNIHGGDSVDLPENEIEDVFEKIHHIMTLKSFLVGMGLGPESEPIITQLLSEAFCKNRVTVQENRNTPNNMLEALYSKIDTSANNIARKVENQMKKKAHNEK